MTTARKILIRSALRRVANRLRRQSKRLVTTNGSFDLLTAGHVHLLEKAKGFGDVLIVGLNSDRSVRRYKSPHRPIVPQAQRARVIAALECVDYVTIFDETEPMRFIESVRPAVHVNDDAYGRDCVEAPTVRRLGATLRLVRRISSISTTAILKKARSLPSI